MEQSASVSPSLRHLQPQPHALAPHRPSLQLSEASRCVSASSLACVISARLLHLGSCHSSHKPPVLRPSPHGTPSWLTSGLPCVPSLPLAQL